MRHLSLSSSRLVHRVAVALLAAPLFVAACSNDSTSNTTPTATGIGIVAGSAQSGTFGTALTNPLQVHVTDQNGNAMSGVLVTFTASGGATLGSTTATTDASGN